MKFSFIKSPGHSEGDLIIITPDRVAFMGDALFSTHTLEKYALTYLLKVDDRLKSLEKIKLIDADYFVISHAPEIVLKPELSDLVELNIQSIYTMIDEIREICNQPVSREDILQNILVLHDMECDYKGYLVNLCSVSAFLNYMLDEKILDVSVENGKLYYYWGFFSIKHRLDWNFIHPWFLHLSESTSNCLLGIYIYLFQTTFGFIKHRNVVQY